MKNFFDKKILPAVTVQNVDSALWLAETFLKGGIDVMEITFRTEVTLSAIRVIARQFPEFKIGAGTILSPDQIPAAMDAGAQFGLAPGCNKNIVEAAQKYDFPFIPGVMTPTEIEQALELGCKILKLFPAGPLGGIGMLKALSGPYKDTGIRFIPMGGVDLANLDDYLALKNVAAAGGSWLAPADLIAEGHREGVSEIVKQSLQIARRFS